LDILPVKKEAKLSASEVPGEVVGSNEEDLQCRSLLTVCQRRLGLSEAEDTRLEKYTFLEDRMSLWYWLRRDISVTHPFPILYNKLKLHPKKMTKPEIDMQNGHNHCRGSGKYSR